MKIATWNVNSVKARLPNLIEWLQREVPDIVCLQELKCVTDAFPYADIEHLGYNIEVFGQKTYNGVALLSRMPIEDISFGLPNFEDEQSRYIEGVISTASGSLRIASLYLPNGNPVEGGMGKKYTYKLDWMRGLKKHVEKLLTYEEAFVLSGDYNVIPSERDVYNPQLWQEDALFCMEIRKIFREIVHLGLVDAVSSLTCTNSDTYTFWDYQGGSWAKNKGIRIDHHLLSPLAANLISGYSIDKYTRSWDRPSDHVPVSVILNMNPMDKDKDRI